MDFAQFHSVSMLIDDTMPPMLETLQSVDKTFRERPHLNSNSTTAYLNETGFGVEFLTPNRGSADQRGAADKNVGARRRFGASPSIFRLPNQKACEVPAPERYAVHQLIVSNLRLIDNAGYAKARKDAIQSELLIEALTLNSREADLGFAWMEAWDRGPCWQENLAAVDNV